MMNRRFSLIVMSLVAGVGSLALGAPHVIPGAYPNAAKDMIHKPSAKLLKAHGSLRAATIATATGTKKVAVIIVQFPAGNASLISGSRTISSVSTIKTYFDSMGAYFTEASYGHLTLTFTYFNSDNATADGDAAPSPAQAGVYTMAHPMEYYGCGDEGSSSDGVTVPASGANGNYLTRDAIIAARNSGHTALKSVDAGGTYDAVIIVHAGNGNETTTNTNGDIWSIFYSQDTDIIGGQSASDPKAVAQAAGFSEGDVVPETETNSITSPLGVMCHEFGHSLGLPDLYNTSSNGGTSVVGKWEIMDSGPYLNAGANPSHPGMWDKVNLGWVTPTIGTTRANVTLNYSATTASALKVPVLNGLTQEYFLIEYRSRTSGATYDRYIPGDGLLIWHVDDALTSSRGINATTVRDQNTVNTGSPHYGVSIVAADGTSIAQSGGAAGNLFTNGQNFIPPSSNNFSGVASGISLVNISGVGSSAVSAQVANLAVSAGQSILKFVSYPNPAGPGYSHPSGAGHATIQMQITRPATEFGFNIYTLSGDLVRKVASTDISLNLDRSADLKWVYEYAWDLKNGDGAMVAPGVYLLLGRADGESKSAKAVIIR